MPQGCMFDTLHARTLHAAWRVARIAATLHVHIAGVRTRVRVSAYAVAQWPMHS
jgi:hypothetical protein